MVPIRQAVVDLLATLEASLGPPPGATDKLAKAQAWTEDLSDLTDEQIRAAGPVVRRVFKAGAWPRPADVREAAYGKIVKVPEYARDLMTNSYLLEFVGGPRKVKRWHDVRVPADWNGDPGELDYDDLPDFALPATRGTPLLEDPARRSRALELEERRRSGQPIYRDELTPQERARSWERARRGEQEGGPLFIGDALNDLELGE